MKCPSFCPLIGIPERVCAGGDSFQSEPWAKLRLEGAINEFNFILNSSFPIFFNEEDKLNPSREGQHNIGNSFFSLQKNYCLGINPDLDEWCSYMNILSCT